MAMFGQVTPSLEQGEQLYATHGAEGALFILVWALGGALVSGAIGVFVYWLRKRATSSAKHADRLEELQIDFVARGLERALGNGALSDIRTTLCAILSRLDSGDREFSDVRDAVQDLTTSVAELRGMMETFVERVERLERRCTHSTAKRKPSEGTDAA